MGAADQGIEIFPDMMFGVSPVDVVNELKSMKVNALRIPVSKPMNSNKAAILVNFVRDIHDNGGAQMAIILSQRKWDLYKISQQEDWANDIAYAYHALDSAGYGSMVKGAVFDENRSLGGGQSNQALWDERHNGILASLDLLNNITNKAFKKRTVFIHGKGYGSQFLGVKASSEATNFAEKMKSRSANYAYTFKYFEAGLPNDISFSGWRSHYLNYCKLSEVSELGVPLVFVGDAGDGLRPNSFVPNTNPYGGSGQYVISALAGIFKDYGWSGFSIGPFVREGSLGQTVLYSAAGGFLNERTAQTDSWWNWYDATR